MKTSYKLEVTVNTNRNYRRYTVELKQTGKGVVFETYSDSLRSALNAATNHVLEAESPATINCSDSTSQRSNTKRHDYQTIRVIHRYTPEHRKWSATHDMGTSRSGQV